MEHVLAEVDACELATLAVQQSQIEVQAGELRERLLSAPFIVSADYGTRCSTVLAIARDGAVHLIERSFNAAGEIIGDVEFRFRSVTVLPTAT